MNLEPAPLSLQIQIESKQSVDELLLDLCEMNLQNVLLSEN
jgi:hypothetical protein